MMESGATDADVILATREGERFPAKHGRSGFRRNFPYNAPWAGKMYASKQLEVFAVEEHGQWLVLTVIVKYF